MITSNDSDRNQSEKRTRSKKKFPFIISSIQFSFQDTFWKVKEIDYIALNITEINSNFKSPV